MIINVYIDWANVHRAIKEAGWDLDYVRFRTWLEEKYKISRAYVFIGLLPGRKNFYTRLQESGFVLVYKQVAYGDNSYIKGNCDSLLVLKVVSDFYEKQFEKAIIVSSDGDFSELVTFLKEKDAMITLLSPNDKCSYLLRKLNVPIVFLSTQRGKIETQEIKKAPGKDETSQGSFS